MRQFVLGLLVAACLYWGYTKWFVGETLAGGPAGPSPTSGNANAPAGGGDLSSLLREAPVESSLDAMGRGATGGRAVGGPAANGAAIDVDALLARFGDGDPAAIAAAWAAVAATGPSPDRTRLLAALQPKGDDCQSLIAALGGDNSFLHSREGRDVAEAARAAVGAMSDADALAAGSRLLFLMAHGRIERDDSDARAAVDQCYRQHRIVVDRWLCSPANVTAARSYTVASGDSLAKIANKFRRADLPLESGTIAVLNRIHNPNLLSAGQQLKIPVDPLVAVLEKRSYALMLFVGNSLLRLYWVGHGADDHTPVTTFTVDAKQPRPQWTSPDGNVYPYGHPKNILGEYFIKFVHPQFTGFGAHGTPMPETICTMSSAGCIRMLAADIQELFEILPRGAQVIVRASESAFR